jgi:hypothetical protein
VCGSDKVIGYLLDANLYEWRWQGEDPFPISYVAGSDRSFDLFSLQPIVCLDCFMCATDIAFFNCTKDGAIVTKSILDENSKLLLSKSIKKRKKMVETEIAVGDKTFDHPRNQLVNFLCYQLAESCARSISLNKKTSNSFSIAYMNYLMIKYAAAERRNEYVDNCRTWFSQVIAEKENYNHLQLSMANFVLVVTNLTLHKIKEAGQIHQVFKDQIESIPVCIDPHSFQSPVFWFNQASAIWQKEISSRTKEMQI